MSVYFTNCFIFDGDKGNYGVGLTENVVPAFELDISGDQGVRTQSSLSLSKGQIEHETSGTNLVLYNSAGSAKAKISPHEDSFFYGGKLTTDQLHSRENVYDYKNHYTATSAIVSGSSYIKGNSYTANTGILSGGLIYPAIILMKTTV